MKGLKVRMMKRLLSSGLVAALIISMLSFSACGKDEMTAIAMRLFYAEGTVGLTDEAGSDKSLVENMNFYTGYHLKTGNDGQAKVSLDETRLITLASDSLLGFEKKGEAMKLSLEEGELFFNVEEKLPESASLEIETSTMVVGIRGTSGIVRALPAAKAAGHGVVLIVTDGEVEVSIKNAKDGKKATVNVGGGESLTMTKTTDSTGRESVDYEVGQVSPEDLPPIAMGEFKESPNLADRVADTYNMESGGLLKIADEVLEKENGDKDKKDSDEKKDDDDKKQEDDGDGVTEDTGTGATTDNGQIRNRTNRQQNANANADNGTGLTQEQIDAANRQLAIEMQAEQDRLWAEEQERIRLAEEEEAAKKRAQAASAEPAATEPSGRVNRTVSISVPSGFCIQFIDGGYGIFMTESNDCIEEVNKVSAKTFRGTSLFPITYTTSEDLVVNPDGAATSRESSVTSMQVSVCFDGSTPLYLNDESGTQQKFDPFGDGFYRATLGNGLGLRYNSATGAAELEM